MQDIGLIVILSWTITGVSGFSVMSLELSVTVFVLPVMRLLNQYGGTLKVYYTF